MQPAWLGGTETDKRRKIFDKILQFSDFSILYACFGAVPCAYLPQGLITELDNGFQQNTRHTGRPSRHPRSIPMRRMFPNWAHRHRPPASHALTGGASVADVLPEGRLPRGDTSAHRSQPAVPRGKCFARREDYHEESTSAHRSQPAVPRGKCFAGREDYHEGAPPHTAPSMRCLRGRCFAGKEDYHERHLRSPPPACRASWKMFCRKGKVPHRRVSGKVTSRQGLRFRLGKCHGEPPACPPCHAADVLSESNRRKRDTRRPHSPPPHHQTPAADETKT